MIPPARATGTRGPLAAGALLAVALGCATVVPAATLQPIDWNAVEEAWSIHLVTRNAEGGARVTRAWIAVMDGQGVMRTGDTLWLHDIQRDPAVCLLVDGEAHPVLGEVVEDETDAGEIASVMVEKYGWQKRWLMAVRPRSGSDSFLRLHPRTADDPQGCPGDDAQAP